MANNIDALRVLFGQGNSVAFESELKEPNKLYFITDKREIYLGGERYAIGKEIQINIVGDGDVVTGATFEPSTKTLTISRGNGGTVPTVVSAIQAALAQTITHIYTDRGSAILVDETDKSNVKLSLNLAQGTYAGNVKLEECSDGLRGNVELPEVPVSGVRSDDKVLRMDGSSIYSTLSITTEAGSDGKQYVILKGVNGVEISKFDASDFVSSGILQSVTIQDISVGGQIHKFLVMTFLVEGGQTRSVQVDLQDLIDTYTAKAGGGLTLDANNAFSISNSVTPNYGVNSDKTIHFGETVTLKTITYDAHGLITGVKDITFRIPDIYGTVGAPADSDGNKTTLLTYVSMTDTGELTGEYVNLSKSVSSVSTDSQIATAKAVYDAIVDHTAKWERF